MKYNKRFYNKNEQGSLTVEATFSLTIFLIAVLSLVYILDILCIYGNINVALYNSTKLTSMNLCKASDMDNGVFKSNIYSSVTVALEEGNVKKKNSVKIDVSDCEYDSESELLYAICKYGVNMPYSFVIGNKGICNKIVMRGWTGNKSLKTRKVFVYITKTGKVYHTNMQCTYLRIYKEKVKLEEIGNYRNEGGGKYYQCKECKNEQKDEYVYITKYGTSYHRNISCCAIKRCIESVEMGQVKGRKKCEKCCKEDVK